ncbi:hypothetical protein [Halogeometricum borinquense]|uniref:hypothetical protein n=1 Tax=Halogeometricum borinquense TaxID=60847 RepID=UPI003443FE0E
MITSTKFDPKVSAPIVCCEYLRATAFFYSLRGSVFLITARHNVLPTHSKIENPVSDGFLYTVTTSGYYPEIDIFLRDGDGWTRKQIDLRGKGEGQVVSHPNIDVVAVEIGFDPRTFGYTVFSVEEVQNRADAEDAVIYGWGHDALPPSEEPHSMKAFAEHVDTPCEVGIKDAQILDGTIVGMGADYNPDGANKYKGLSGSPVLGNDLLGVYSGTAFLGPEAVAMLSSTGSLLRMHFYGLDFLEVLLG